MGRISFLRKTKQIELASQVASAFTLKILECSKQASVDLLSRISLITSLKPVIKSSANKSFDLSTGLKMTFGELEKDLLQGGLKRGHFQQDHVVIKPFKNLVRTMLLLFSLLKSIE